MKVYWNNNKCNIFTSYDSYQRNKLKLN